MSNSTPGRRYVSVSLEHDAREALRRLRRRLSNDLGTELTMSDTILDVEKRLSSAHLGTPPDGSGEAANG